MSAVELDSLDAAIVRELRADGRLPFETLAGRVGLSRAATRLRVRRLVDSGALRVVGVPHPAVRDVGAPAHLAVAVRGGAREAAEALARLPEAAQVGLASGPLPVRAEMRAHDLRGLTAAVERVRALPGVRGADTLVYTDVVKDPRLSSAPPPRVRPDAVDLRLVGLLEADGRMSFADMAGRVGLSAGAVRTRVMRLIRGGAVRVTALLDPGAVGMARYGGFTARLEERGGAAVAEITGWEHTRFLARCLGGADLVGVVAAGSVPDLGAVFERLRRLPGVAVTETWIRLESVSGAD
ncbi:Lrp/AsnC family transcriptional regulator [Streptomonospora sp. S1-112]|uniref:Lrp/AsnC family transcriptional regulator n=1 Tax=Streptomonospora mangrovi TaxID=2883123 RepID=A0A9X3NQM0_9ACTN|nr:Lrp/AsnC family transcriptional regulator [Streptomonospora mangrovi]MDA0567617.1 Lrp/AsnC family transcriptional regulator [Streptomonospora mangrovi]